MVSEEAVEGFETRRVVPQRFLVELHSIDLVLLSFVGSGQQHKPQAPVVTLLLLLLSGPIRCQRLHLYTLTDKNLVFKRVLQIFFKY